MEGVEERLSVVRARIARAGGDPSAVRVVAVTKGFGPEAVAAARAAGLEDIGENYAEELAAKHDGRPRWHFLGAVQRRKVRRLAALTDVWEGVDRLAAGREIAARAPGGAVLAQVNVTGEARRNGCTWDDAPELVAGLRALGLDVRGVMCVGPHGPPESARPYFRRVERLADDLELIERSMGMSADLEVAVAEGATEVRLGTALFGPRPAPTPRRPTAHPRGPTG